MPQGRSGETDSIPQRQWVMPGAGATEQPWQWQHQLLPERGHCVCLRRWALGWHLFVDEDKAAVQFLFLMTINLRAFVRGKEDGLPKTSRQWACASQVLVKG